MPNFTLNDFRCFEKSPSSPGYLQNNIWNLVSCSMVTKTKVESMNPETGEYRIVLSGTLDLDSTGNHHGNH